MKPPKLDRSETNTINANQGDTLELWPSPIQDGRHNLNLTDSTGNTVITIYGLTSEQLAAFSLAIAETFGRAPDLTRTHLEQVHRLLGRLLSEG